MLLTGGSAVDSRRNVMEFDDLWSFDGSAWIALGPPGDPMSGIRIQADAQHRIYSLGGFADFGNGALRVLENNRWRRLPPSPSEAMMGEPGFVFDAARNRFVAFGSSAASADVIAQERTGLTLRDLVARVNGIVDNTNDLIIQLQGLKQQLDSGGRRVAPGPQALALVDSTINELTHFRDSTLTRPEPVMGYRQYPRLRAEVTTVAGMVWRGIHALTASEKLRTSELKTETDAQRCMRPSLRADICCTCASSSGDPAPSFACATLRRCCRPHRDPVRLSPAVPGAALGVRQGDHHCGPPLDVAWPAAIALLPGVLRGAASIAARSLWLPIGIHASWDFLPGNVAADAPGIFQIEYRGPRWLTGGPLAPDGSLLEAILILPLSVALLREARLRGRIHGGPDTRASPTSPDAPRRTE